MRRDTGSRSNGLSSFIYIDRGELLGEDDGRKENRRKVERKCGAENGHTSVWLRRTQYLHINSIDVRPFPTLHWISPPVLVDAVRLKPISRMKAKG